MTLNTIENRRTYSGNGVSTAFAFDLEFPSQTDLTVTLVDNITGVETPQIITTNYSVSGAGNPSGGAVTMLTPPASGETLVINRELPFTQGRDFILDGGTDPEQIEAMADEMHMKLQQLKDALSRVVQLSPADPSETNLILPTAVANALWGWNSTADAVENKVLADLSTTVVSTFMNTFLQQSTAPLALNELGFSSYQQGTIVGLASAAAYQSALSIVITALASQAEAEAGTNNTKGMTPLRTAQAIAKRNGFDQSNYSKFSDHKADGTDAGGSVSGTWTQRGLNTEDENNIAGAGVVYLLPYDNQSSNFTVGDTVTGGTSGATATIVADVDAGPSGTLSVINITGTFVDNEVITGGLGGSADTNQGASPNDPAKGVHHADQFYLPAGTYYINCLAQVYNSLGFQHRIYNVTDAQEELTSTNGYATAAANQYCYGDAPIMGHITLGGAKILRVETIVGQTQASNGLGFNDATALGDEIYMELEIRKVA